MIRKYNPNIKITALNIRKNVHIRTYIVRWRIMANQGNGNHDFCFPRWLYVILGYYVEYLVYSSFKCKRIIPLNLHLRIITTRERCWTGIAMSRNGKHGGLPLIFLRDLHFALFGAQGAPVKEPAPRFFNIEWNDFCSLSSAFTSSWSVNRLRCTPRAFTLASWMTKLFYCARDLLYYAGYFEARSETFNLLRKIRRSNDKYAGKFGR